MNGPIRPRLEDVAFAYSEITFLPAHFVQRADPDSCAEETHGVMRVKVLPPVKGFVGAIGNTPLIRLNRLSERTGCNIYGKAGTPHNIG